ncbi:MAG: hypothetical protein LH603_03540 [Pseudonocardia sp.]|nr:hypothetical protein [Pseudonocardia sp.]
MARSEPDGSVWGRPEAVDTLGRRPGQRRWAMVGLGMLSLGLGAYLGTSTATGAAAGPTAPAAVPALAAPTAEVTCSAVGVTLEPGAYPAEGVPVSTAVRLYRTDPNGEAVMLVPEAYVWEAAAGPGGVVTLSVLVRSGPPGDAQQVVDVTGASAAKKLTATVLYDVVANDVLDECRAG